MGVVGARSAMGQYLVIGFCHWFPFPFYPENIAYTLIISIEEIIGGYLIPSPWKGRVREG